MALRRKRIPIVQFLPRRLAVHIITFGSNSCVFVLSLQNIAEAGVGSRNRLGTISLVTG